MLENQAQRLFDEGRFDEAIAAAETAVDSAAKLYDPARPHTAGALADCLLVEGDIKRHTGYLTAAAEIYQRVIELSNFGGSLESAVAFAHSGLGDIAEERSAPIEALRHYEEAVRLLDGSGRSAEESARLHNNLAMLYKDEGDFEAAERHFIEGVRLMESRVGRMEETTATLYNNLATLYFRAGHLEKAMEMALLARDIRTQILPEGHADLSQALSNLGAIQYAMGHLDVAIQSFDSAVVALEASPDADPVEYEVVVSNYIDLLQEAGLQEEADKITRRARERYSNLMRARAS